MNDFVHVVFVTRARLLLSSGITGCIKKKKKKKLRTTLLEHDAASGIINSLLYGLTYNTCGHFALCSNLFSYTTQLAKYPRVLYVKLYNKVFLFCVCK